MKSTTTHIYFWKGYMSNWHKSNFNHLGFTYNCAEQAMMHLKAAEFRDFDTAERIMCSSSPAQQKFYGRCVQNYDEELWNSKRFDIVCGILQSKFEQNPDLKFRLLSTDNKILVEASPEDCIWGVGLEENDPLILDEKNWRGQNLLGKALMVARERIRGIL